MCTPHLLSQRVRVWSEGVSCVLSPKDVTCCLEERGQSSSHPVFGSPSRGQGGRQRGQSPGAPGEGARAQSSQTPQPTRSRFWTHMGGDAPCWHLHHSPTREPASSSSRLQALAGSWLDRQTDAENVTDERSGLGVDQGPSEEALITVLSSALLGQTRLAGPHGHRALGPGAP